MNLATYVGVQYCVALSGVSIGLTVVYNLIELMEKLTRTNASITSILTFVSLNLGPTLLTMLPVSGWLAMLLLIYRLRVHDEWTVCRILGLRASHLIKPILLTLLVFMAGILVLKHYLLDDFATQAQRYHTAVFKHQPATKLHNQWYALSPTVLAHVATFDQASNQGEGLTLYIAQKSSTTTSSVTYPSFTIEGHCIQGTAAYHTPLSRQKNRPWPHRINQPLLTHLLRTTAANQSFFTLLATLWSNPPAADYIQDQCWQHLLPLVECSTFALLTLFLFLLLLHQAPTTHFLAAGAYPLALLVKQGTTTLWPHAPGLLIGSYMLLLLLAYVWLKFTTAAKN